MDKINEKRDPWGLQESSPDRFYYVFEVFIQISDYLESKKLFANFTVTLQ